MNKYKLTVGSGLFALMAGGSAVAQAMPQSSAVTSPVATAALLSAVPAGATADAPAASAAPAPASDAVAEVVVYGQGQTRQVETISSAQILAALPGVSPLKVLAKLPSVNFESADAFGAYEWSTHITVRAFNQNQLGFTLDGVPLGDMSYANYNGLHISRAISSENIASTTLNQGTGSLDTASSSNLGGTIAFQSIAPSIDRGIYAEGAYGSYSDYRIFARLDSGELATGTRFYLSGGYQFSDKWKGDGEQKTYQFNTKFMQPIGGNSMITGFANYSDRRENDYQDLTLNWIKEFGYRLDNISNNYALVEQIATAYQTGGAYPAPFTNTPDAVDAAYANASGLRRDVITGLADTTDILPNLKFKTTVYLHHNDGMGQWWTPYTPTPAADGGSPISVRTTEYDITREGDVSTLTYTLGANTIEAGLWYEYNNFTQARRYYPLQKSYPSQDSLSFLSDPFFTQWKYHYLTNTIDLSLQDTWQITDALKFNAGFKSLDVDTRASTKIGSPVIDGSLSATNHFLPSVGLNYTLSPGMEVFADYAENMRAYQPGTFQTTQAAFDLIRTKIKPETSDTFEGGYRLHLHAFQGVIDAYYVKFYNRLNAETVGSPIQGLPASLENVGSVTARGLEVAGTWEFAKYWSLYGSYALDDATYDNDERDGNGAFVAATAGKYVVDTPKDIANIELDYDDGSWFGNIHGNYMSKRFYTYTNDGVVPAHAVWDLAGGYRVHSAGLANGLEIQANITNLFNKGYIATIGENGFIDSDPTGSFQSVLAGAPREFFLTVRKKF